MSSTDATHVEANEKGWLSVRVDGLERPRKQVPTRRTSNRGHPRIRIYDLDPFETVVVEIFSSEGTETARLVADADGRAHVSFPTLSSETDIQSDRHTSSAYDVGAASGKELVRVELSGAHAEVNPTLGGEHW